MSYDFDPPSAKQVATGARWFIATLVLALLAAVVIGSMAIFGWGWFQRSTADFRGETAALEQIKADPDSRISAYEHFFNLCASIQGHEDAIRALQAELDGGPSESRAEQIRGAITANQAKRDGKIRQYNADASKDYTVGQFRDANLPHQISTDSEETTCTAS